MLTIKRVYEDPAPGDGYRILVDRLWPRGLAKERAALDLWAKEVTPSDALRRAFHEGELDFAAFSGAYRAELKRNTAAPAFVQTVKEKLAQGNVTLLFAAKATVNTHAAVLRDYLEGQLK